MDRLALGYVYIDDIIHLPGNPLIAGVEPADERG